MAGLIGRDSKTLRVEEFRSSGTWANPGVKTVALFMVPGGGAGIAGAGGQGGNIVEVNYDVDGKASCDVIIGAGGTGGSNGGNTTFDGVVVAVGGKAGGGYATPVISAVTGKNGFGGHGPNSINNAPVTNGAGDAAGPANSGAGGAVNTPGGSGYLRVEWYE